MRDLTVVILDRPRHAELIEEVRAAGARIRLITDGDVYGSIAAGSPGSGVDVLMGIGGTPEGVISAAALKCMGGEIQGRLWPRNDEEKAAIEAAGLDISTVLTTDDARARRQLLLRRHRHHRRPAPRRRPLRRPRHHDPEPRHALAQRHRAAHRRPPPAGQAAGLLRRRLLIAFRPLAA